MSVFKSIILEKFSFYKMNVLIFFVKTGKNFLLFNTFVRFYFCIFVLIMVNLEIEWVLRPMWPYRRIDDGVMKTC